MLRISRMADYALVLMSEMAVSGKNSASSLNLKTNISESAIMKILKTLAQNKILISIRGANGGYELSKKPEEVKIIDIISVIDGPVNLTICSDNRDLCEIESGCTVKKGLMKLNSEVKGLISSYYLSDFITINKAESKRNIEG